MNRLCLLASILAISTAPSFKSTAAETVTIVFESYNYATVGLGGAGTKQLIDEFEASHPGIEIDPVGTPTAEIHTSVQRKAAAGDAPDIAQIGLSKFAFVVENLPYVPFGDFVDSDVLGDHLAGMLPSVAGVATHDDVVVGIPYTLSTPTLLINADLFREAGLDPAAPPTTWEEVRVDALAIADTGAQGVYVDAAGEAKSDFLTQSLVNSNGGKVMDAQGRPTFDSPAAVGALSMLGDLTASGAQPAVAESEALALFEAGELGMLVTSTAAFAGLVAATEGSFELDAAALPSYGDLPVAPTVSGAALFVFADEPAQQAAAWEFVSFLTGDRGQTIVTSQIGYLPLRPTIVEADDGLAPFFAADDRLLPAVEQLAAVEPYQVFPGPDGTRATQLLQDGAVAPIMLSGADPASTLTAVAAEVEQLLGD